MLDENLKNKDGESNLEVRTRMLSFLNDILSELKGKAIAIVSHGGAIKFLLQNWCEYEWETNSFTYNGKFVCNAKLESPSVIKLVFENDELLDIENIRINL